MPRPLQAGGESVRIESCLRLKLRAAGRHQGAAGSGAICDGAAFKPVSSFRIYSTYC